jgi:hypothetical protein
MHCTPADVSDDAGLLEMLSLNIDYFKSNPMNIPKITILLDHGYHVEHLVEELEQVYPQMMTKIRFVDAVLKVKRLDWGRKDGWT